MVDLSLSTLVVSIQSVQKQIEHFEGLLESGDLKDEADIQELLLAYDQAADELKEAYIAMRTPGSNFPDYEGLVGVR
ncbi:hypothetical protein [Marinobacter sp. CA1]|uniref:hypothetical protein n=1 Tax=Marinobacter sp. CA1 TaxID=2817656 RepID=UPI001D08E603|nr:hypothetical protein [Marinobacter sp. CA1]UDL04242.1 hypothetical protein J2887_16275 [Marinobacter sp. CA1]